MADPREPTAETADLPLAPARRSRESIPPLPRGTKVGRYVIVDLLGEGGMSVVYRASDPELGRTVAVKLVAVRKHRAESSVSARDRLLREAQALARVSHPNVVAVHDVGTHEDSVFIAMELVEGQTLRDWLDERPRGEREILAALCAAGRGLAAAHAVGLVHRDFKPSNVVMARDGRVLVIDFGLARAAGDVDVSAGGSSQDLLGDDDSSSNRLASPLTAVGTLVGTHGYISPEQYRGEGADERSDQFMFAVTVFEALVGRRPWNGPSREAVRADVLAGRVSWPDRPRCRARLRRAVMRGLSPDPGARYPSMRAFIDDLERDPARARWRAAAIAAPVALLGVVAWLALRAPAAGDPCARAGEPFAAVWNPAAAGGLRAAFVATKRGHAADTAGRVIAGLEAWGGRWRGEAVEACRDTHVRHARSPAELDRRTACLERRLAGLKAVLAQLTDAPSGEVVDSAVTAVGRLASPGDCRDETTLRLADAERAAAGIDPVRLAETRAELDRVRALDGTGQVEKALAGATPLVEAARAVGAPRLLAEALLERAELRVLAGEHRLAEPDFVEAAREAARAGDTGLVARAQIGTVGVLGKLTRFAEALAAAELADAAVLGAGDPAELRAKLLVARGRVHYGKGEQPQARAAYLAALERLEKDATATPAQLAAMHNEIGHTFLGEGNLVEARARYQRALELWEQALGPDHPTLATPLENLAIVAFGEGKLKDARAAMERALAIAESAFGPDAPTLATTLVNLAIMTGPDELQLARAYLERALAITEKAVGPEHPSVASILGSLGDAQFAVDDLVAAEASYRRALAIYEKAHGPDFSDAGYALLGLGQIAFERGRLPEARALAERALRLREPIGDDPLVVARIRYLLAKIYWATPAERRRARPLAKAAHEAFAAAGEVAVNERDAVAAWLAKR